MLLSGDKKHESKEATATACITKCYAQTDYPDIMEPEKEPALGQNNWFQQGTKEPVFIECRTSETL